MILYFKQRVHSVIRGQWIFADVLGSNYRAYADIGKDPLPQEATAMSTADTALPSPADILPSLWRVWDQELQSWVSEHISIVPISLPPANSPVANGESVIRTPPRSTPKRKRSWEEEDIRSCDDPNCKSCQRYTYDRPR